jgi:hypothetical protein
MNWGQRAVLSLHVARISEVAFSKGFRPEQPSDDGPEELARRAIRDAFAGK